jgi:phage baseplate assembly protein W
MSDTAKNILIPFRRDKKRDFASGTGVDLLRSKVIQALMTEGATAQSQGELPWRTAFGAGLQRLRHQRNDAALSELARIYVRDALRRWVPEAEITEINVNHNDANLNIQLRVRDKVGNTEAVVEVER